MKDPRDLNDSCTTVVFQEVCRELLARAMRTLFSRRAAKKMSTWTLVTVECRGVRRSKK
jgi:hypothetical protein